jgi:hypothetical protein
MFLGIRFTDFKRLKRLEREKQLVQKNTLTNSHGNTLLKGGNPNCVILSGLWKAEYIPQLKA